MDIYLQRAAPAGLESNWLPAQAGRPSSRCDLRAAYTLSKQLRLDPLG